jgi:hypothetical protein
MLAYTPATAPEILDYVSYVALQAHRIIKVEFHREYSIGIIFV